MPHTVELHFDKRSNDIIQNVWHDLERSCGEAYLPNSGFPPHITLALYDDTVDKNQLLSIVEKHKRNFRGFSLRFPGLGFFTGEKDASFFLVPTASRELLDVHEKFHSDAHTLRSSLIGHYRIGEWVPHCTVTMGTPITNMPSCLERLVEIKSFFQAEIVHLHSEEFEF